MNTNIRIFVFVVVGVAVLAISFTVLAISKDDIVYPIAELGNCPNEQACFAYCDAPANLNQCLDFAAKHNLLSKSEVDKAKKFQSIGAVGPGGCTSELECENYCENVNNIEECLAFAEQHGFMDDKELEEAKKIAEVLRQGAQLPGACISKASCEAYCEDPNNMRECIAFAEAAGFMSPEELQEAKQVLKALDAGIPMPGNCRGERACEAYCEDQAHMEECVEFALAAGFIPPEEAEQVRRMIPLMKEGKMPKGCMSGREQCEAYCADDANIEECTTFFVEAGFMTHEEAEMFQKTGGKGPGDCKGREECEAFCNNPANQQACFTFGTEHGLISEEQLHNIEQGIKQFKEGFAQAPPEVEQCLRKSMGQDVLDKMEAGMFLPSPEMGDIMRRCFKESFSRPERGEFGPPPGFEEGEELFPSGEDQRFPQQFKEEHLKREFEQQFQQKFEQEVQGEFEEQFQEQFEQQFQQQFEQKFERKFQEQQQQQQLEHLQEIIPQVPKEDLQLKPRRIPSLEDIQRIEREEAATLQQQQRQQQQQQVEQRQLEQELQQQFQKLDQLQQQLQEQLASPQGSLP